MKRSIQEEHQSAAKRRTEQIDSEVASTSKVSISGKCIQLDSTVSERGYGLAGRVEKIQMTNFMCHSNLEVTFNRRINFVTGRNGSGKSAVMAALIVVLGGSASLTGRGSGVADFIKKGEHTGKVSITLVNEGRNPYKKDVYGSRIIIVRTFSRTAINTYACKSENGHVVSKKKEEVDRICTHLNLQIKNPICVLNQDVARSFLGSSDDSLRYSMFMKATQLEDIRRTYANTFESLVATQRELEKKKDRLVFAEQEVGQLKEKLAYFAMLQKHKEEKTLLENEYFWSMVCAEENKWKELSNKKDELEQKKADMLLTESNHDGLISSLQDEIQKVQEKLNEVGEKRDETHTSRNDALRESQSFQHQIDSLQSQIRNLTNKMERQQADINSIKEHVDQADVNESRQQRETDIAAERMRTLTTELSDIRDRLMAAKRDADNARETDIQQKMAIESDQTDLRDLESNKRHIQIQIEGLQRKGNSDLLKFGDYVPKLLEAIDDAAKKNHFIQKPIGPCGAYVTLNCDPKWAHAVESVVAGLMTTFCCDNQKDFQVLSRIMDKVVDGGKQPPVIICKFLRTRHNVSSRKVTVRGYNSILDVLNFNNDVVFNTFVDQASIETILLFETDKQAASLLTHIQNVPKNLRIGVTINADQYYPAPNYRTYCGNKREARFFTGTQNKEQIRKKLEEEVKALERSIQEKKVALSEATKKLTKTKEFIQKTETCLRQFREKQRRIEAEMNGLRDVEESRPMMATRVALEEELQVLEKYQQEAKEKMSQCKEQIETLKLKKKEYVEKATSAANEERSLSEEIRAMEEKLDETKYRLNKQKQRKQGSSSKMNEVQKCLNELIESIKSARRLIQRKTEEAKEVCPERVDTERTPIEVQKQLEKCEAFLRKAERVNGTREDAITEYKTKQSTFKYMRKIFDELEKVIRKLSFTIVAKEEWFDNLRKQTANLVGLHFQASLATRGYEGSLNFDFSSSILEIEVRPRDSQSRKDSKTLSGGERSYSTVSFILSIWRSVFMPFYFLDEFDVFMDKVNRKTIMDLLIDHAQNNSKMQFVFITPQDISNITASEMISIYKMPDPER